MGQYFSKITSSEVLAGLAVPLQVGTGMGILSVLSEHPGLVLVLVVLGVLLLWTVLVGLILFTGPDRYGQDDLAQNTGRAVPGSWGEGDTESLGEMADGATQYGPGEKIKAAASGTKDASLPPLNFSAEKFSSKVSPSKIPAKHVLLVNGHPTGISVILKQGDKLTIQSLPDLVKDHMKAPRLPGDAR